VWGMLLVVLGICACGAGVVSVMMKQGLLDAEDVEQFFASIDIPLQLHVDL
jgi:hypothetical protein